MNRKSIWMIAAGLALVALVAVAWMALGPSERGAAVSDTGAPAVAASTGSAADAALPVGAERFDTTDAYKRTVLVLPE